MSTGTPYQPAMRAPSATVVARLALVLAWAWLLSFLHWLACEFVTLWLAPVSAVIVGYVYRLRVGHFVDAARFRRRWSRAFVATLLALYLVFASLAWFVSFGLDDLGIPNYNALEIIAFLDVPRLWSGLVEYAASTTRVFLGMPLRGWPQWSLYATELVAFLSMVLAGLGRPTPIVHCTECDRSVTGLGARFLHPGGDVLAGLQRGELDAFVVSGMPAANDDASSPSTVLVHVYRCPKCLSKAPAWMYVRASPSAGEGPGPRVPVACDFELAGKVDRRCREVGASLEKVGPSVRRAA